MVKNRGLDSDRGWPELSLALYFRSGAVISALHGSLSALHLPKGDGAIASLCPKMIVRCKWDSSALLMVLEAPACHLSTLCTARLLSPLPSSSPYCLSRAGLGARHSILWVHRLQVQRKASSLWYWILQDGDSFYKPLVREPIWRKLNHSLRLSASYPKSLHKHSGQASAASHQGLNHSFKIKTSLIALCL